MKFFITMITLFITSCSLMSQQDVLSNNKYIIKACKIGQSKVYFKIKAKRDTLEKGLVLIEKRGNKTVHRTLQDTIIIVSKVDSAVTINGTWRASEVSHTDSEPGKLYLNPWTFTKDSMKTLNGKAYLKIPANSYVKLRHDFYQFSALTIPFAIRPALNDEIGSKITTDVNLGLSFSYNITWEKFRNRRIKATKSVIGISFGVGTGLTSVSLDENNTSLSNSPLESSEDGLAMFFAPGIGINIRGLNIAVFRGYDLAITDNVSQWNYDGKGYWGLGLGINLKTLGKLK